MTSRGRRAWQVLLPAVLLPVSVLAAPVADASDTTRHSTLIITPRVNSTGHFPFSGALLNYHLNADLNIYYDHTLWGFFLFKSYDIPDRHSYVNYLQPGIFGTLKLAPSIKVRGVFGYVFSQTTHFRDDESDYYAAGVIYWDLSPHWKLEHTALYYDFTTSDKLANRTLISWHRDKFRIEGYFWRREVFEERHASASASLAITFPILRLSEKSTLQFTSAYEGFLTTAKPDYALRKGFLFTVAAPLTF